MAPLLPANLNDLLGLHGFVASATFGIQKLEKFLQRVGVCGIAEKSAFSLNMHQVLRFELVKMMREGGVWNLQLFLNLADDQTLRVGGQQQLHDSESRLGPHGGEHVSVLGDLLGGFLRLASSRISIFAEIWMDVKRVSLPARSGAGWRKWGIPAGFRQSAAGWLFFGEFRQCG
jgi:hypothetical protein